jgi:hypothetical protein
VIVFKAFVRVQTPITHTYITTCMKYSPAVLNLPSRVVDTDLLVTHKMVSAENYFLKTAIPIFFFKSLKIQQINK